MNFSLIRRLPVALATLALMLMSKPPALDAAEPFTPSSQATADRAQVLCDALEGELARRRKTPQGLGMGNGAGVDISGIFNITMPAGLSERDVTETLKTAGFSMFPVSGPDDGVALNAAKDLEASWLRKTYVIAIVKMRLAGDGGQELAQVRAALKWDTL